MGEQNKERAERAKQMVLGHRSADPNDLYSDVVDVLTDLLHLADAEKYDFEAQLETARRHHEAEVEDDE